MAVAVDWPEPAAGRETRWRDRVEVASPDGRVVVVVERVETETGERAVSKVGRLSTAG